MTVIPFIQPPASPFSFIATLDGEQYTCTVPWNVFGQRYYLNVFTLDGTRVLTIALVSGTDAFPINLIRGYFVNSIFTWSDVNQQFTITP